MEVRHMKQGLRRKGIWIAAAAVLISLSVAVYAACPQTLCAKENTQCVRGTAAIGSDAAAATAAHYLAGIAGKHFCDRKYDRHET